MRLDNALVELGLAPSRARARDAILRGHVTVNGKTTGKPSLTVTPNSQVDVDDPVLGYVSRAALKLVAGLDHFGYSPAGRTALDIGAATGGFTEVLLKCGANRVIGVDVGHKQLHERLAADPRVVSLEGTNARDLTDEIIGEPISAFTADVSFISLTLALPPALVSATEDAWGIFLVKPQFEVGRDRIGKGGIVRDHVTARAAVDRIGHWIERDLGWTLDGTIDSPISGGDGNHEYLIGARRG